MDLLKTFVNHGMPGMSLARRVSETVRPLVHRCPCGRQISENRIRCRACQEAWLAQNPQPQETAHV
jgi:hypothetical protein